MTYQLIGKRVGTSDFPGEVYRYDDEQLGIEVLAHGRFLSLSHILPIGQPTSPPPSSELLMAGWRLEEWGKYLRDMYSRGQGWVLQQEPAMPGVEVLPEWGGLRGGVADQVPVFVEKVSMWAAASGTGGWRAVSAVEMRRARAWFSVQSTEMRLDAAGAAYLAGIETFTFSTHSAAEKKVGEFTKNSRAMKEVLVPRSPYLLSWSVTDLLVQYQEIRDRDRAEREERERRLKRPVKDLNESEFAERMRLRRQGS